MCGIGGIFEYQRDRQVSRNVLEKMRCSLATRGPDDSAVWIDACGRTGLAHTRLSILDTSQRARQPMHSSDDRYVLTYNGEIYNYLELRQQLEARGHNFTSTGDSEVLLKMYAEFGADMLRQLRGMFSFGIWDSQLQELFLARDPLGIKPLYYSDSGSTLYFASQVKSLLQIECISTSSNPAGLVGFLAWGSVPEPHTLYREIKAVPTGHYLRVRRDHAPQTTRYFSIVEEMLASEDRHEPKSHAEMQERVLEALRESVRYHLVSDVPVSVFLSSGLDSASITALASGMSTNLHTTTLGFDEFRGTSNDETPLAEVIARLYRTQHQTAWISKQLFAEHEEHLLTSMDQPSIDGVNTYFVSMVARQSGHKVALSGIGGDELFGGYPSFTQVPLTAAALPLLGANVPGVGRTARSLTAKTIARFGSPKLASMLELGGTIGGAYFLRRGLLMPWEIESILGERLTISGWEELASIPQLNHYLRPLDAIDVRRHRNFARIASLELTAYMRNQLLRDADWAGMAHSLEIRVPLVDVSLYRAVLPMHFSSFNPRKRDMVARLSPPLPQQVRVRRKTGFSIPVRDWLPANGGRGMRGWALCILDRFAPGLLGEARIPIAETQAS